MTGSFDRAIVRKLVGCLLNQAYGMKRRKAKEGLAAAVGTVVESEALQFFEELLSHSEFGHVKKKWRVLYELAKTQRLEDKKHAKQIADECDVSPNFVTTVKQDMFEKNGVCRKLIEAQLDEQGIERKQS